MKNDLNNAPVQGQKVVSRGPDVSRENAADRSRAVTELERSGLVPNGSLLNNIAAHNRDALFAALAEAKIRNTVIKLDYSGRPQEEIRLIVLAHQIVKTKHPISKIPVTIQYNDERVDSEGLQ
jgi:hypothetical protein